MVPDEEINIHNPEEDTFNNLNINLYNPKTKNLDFNDEIEEF